VNEEQTRFESRAKQMKREQERAKKSEEKGVENE